MKKLLFITSLLVIALAIAAQLNYLAAIDLARQTDGSDGDICAAMQLHGFCEDGDVLAYISFTDKVKALFTSY